jgi:hypothetical protein
MKAAAAKLSFSGLHRLGIIADSHFVSESDSVSFTHRFATSIPKIIAVESAVVQSAEILSSHIPFRAAKRLKNLAELPKDWPGIDRLVNRYESLVSCPFPGYYDGHLMEMDVSKSMALGIWLENNVQLLEQDIFCLQSQFRDMILKGSLSRTHPAIEPFISATYTHLITMRILSSQHKAYTDIAAMKPEDRTVEHYAKIPVVTADCDLKQLASDTAEDCRAFCVEKHGEAPEIIVSTGQKNYHCKPKPASNGSPTAPDSLIIEGEKPSVVAFTRPHASTRHLLRLRGFYRRRRCRRSRRNPSARCRI